MRTHVLRRTLLLAAVTATTIAGSAIAAAPAHAATGTSTITGHLTDAAGSPAANVYVYAQKPDVSATAWTYTDVSGAYTLPNLPDGEYKVSYRASGSNFTQWAHQKLDFFSGDTITVGAGATVVVDDQFLPTGTIAGRLTNRDGTSAQALIIVYHAEQQNYVTSWSTQPDGTFAIELPAGSYKLDFRVRNVFDQWSGGKLSFETAVPVEVTAGQSVQVNETVLPTGSLGGQLTNADGSVAANVGVTATLTGVDNVSRWGTTDDSGRYRFDDLLLGDYIVQFSGPRWVPQYAHGALDQAQAARFTVADGQLTTVDEAFLPLGTVRILAHDATTGAPLSDFCAYVLVQTNISGCASGTELLLTDVFVGTWHFDVNINDRIHFEVPDAPATVVAGQTTTIDVAMRQGATITATMVKRDGGAATDGCINVANTNSLFNYTSYGYCSDWSPGPVPGSVVIGPLETGTYQLFADPRDEALGMQWVGATGGTGDRGAAQQFTVAAGDQITAPAIQFDKGGTIRGKVTDVNTGAPIEYACVWVAALSPSFDGSGECPSSTAADGTYSIPGVGPYAWPVEFARGGYQWRWSGNAVNRHEATTVTVLPGKKVAANIRLRTGGGTLTGTIHDASGHPVDATVVAYDVLSGEAVQFGGGLTPQGQPPATYTINNIAPQQVKIYYWVPDGRRGWVGGADLAHAQTYQIRNNRTTTVNLTIP